MFFFEHGGILSIKINFFVLVKFYGLNCQNKKNGQIVVIRQVFAKNAFNFFLKTMKLHLTCNNYVFNV